MPANPHDQQGEDDDDNKNGQIKPVGQKEFQPVPAEPFPLKQVIHAAPLPAG
jgi:hypothetical protein